MALKVFRVNVKFDLESNMLALFTQSKTLYIRIHGDDIIKAEQFFEYLSNKSKKIPVPRLTDNRYKLLKKY